jgi:hypothetical protein
MKFRKILYFILNTFYRERFLLFSDSRLGTLFAFPFILVKRETYLVGKQADFVMREGAEQEINYFPPSKHQNSPKLSRTRRTCGDNEIGAGSWEIVIKKAKSVKACTAALRAILRNAILGRWSRQSALLC